MMYTIESIASYILNKHHLTNLQLNQCLYVCFGFYGANTDKYLFKNDIEAWQCGVVIPNIYHKLKHFENETISSNLFYEAKPLDGDVIKIIESVLTIYGRDSNFDMLKHTNAIGSIWHNVFKGTKTQINKVLIIDYYKQINSASKLLIKHYELFKRLAST